MKNNRLNREKVRDWFKAYKKTIKCKCGESHPATIDFHHKKDDKKYLISNMIWSGKSTENIKKEISKCEVLCANCHRKLHYEEKQ